MRICLSFSILLGQLLICASWTKAADPVDATTFAVGVASRDITPQKPTPMWGYGDRHAMLSQGTLDPLYAKAVVIHAGQDKLAIVGTDLGRGPTAAMMEEIRAELREKAGIEHCLITGSHSHHTPVIELIDREGLGKGTFDDAVAYSQSLPDMLVEVICEADAAVQPARVGAVSKEVSYNRNRQSKREPKAVDPMLGVIRFDDLEGKPIAVLVNFAAHPVMTSPLVLKFSADYPGFMKKKVEESLSTFCVFLQGASGDMSVNAPEGVSGPQAFGEVLADQVIELAESCVTAVPDEPSIQAKVDPMKFESRVEFNNPLVMAAYSKAFFPELVQNYAEESRNGINTELNTVLLNKHIALVGGSGEFFCNHANLLKQRSYVDHTFFLGYCNGHNLYFPTIEAVSEGGYGADPGVAPVEIGAGERMMNRALMNLYTMLGKFPKKKAANQ
ncbi:MAG: neutral/alkaline non-lysosomal ceramidase N-terminal domain-containing protein [Pirellulales bacterium]